ncbi:phosphoenolpyruvate--protein phosphotransferase [[Clostridium] aminophilum]|uniref:Phosphoenolpyruvate-protein phosphotransferase n=1 Tax=[Clostridium] aminophilum TaxID=1526 RepID=A0A1I6IBV0_9FIRM|nr:phosphoenolpyruvate--protein phosphotransferase [[Clostridium] aminophilum]MCR4629901.1 phosphoenolpyruvate--protein phosphotransferase [Clostridium sp.]SFR64166.1 phosphotransferase system, enzyme I, PtsI [[Clostridium] aminophilum]
MQVVTGKSVLNGIAVGRIRVYKAPKFEISEKTVDDAQVEMELGRFEAARLAAIDQQNELHDRAVESAGEESAEIFSVHAMLLDDEDLVDAVNEIISEEKHTAEYAVKTAFDNQAKVFAEMEDAYFRARSADIIDIENAVLGVLLGMDLGSKQGGEPAILVADDLAPSETVRLDKSLLLGIITKEGSLNSHTAILARSMNLPALVQCREISDDWDGHEVIIDGYNACAYIDPNDDLRRNLLARKTEDDKQRALLQELKGRTNTTIDGTKINVYANIGGPSDIEAVKLNDAGGVGLFRSEFVYLNSSTAPTEEQQFAAYKEAVEALAPKLVIIRTCDIGADKQVDYMNLDKEENPALGYRAIRICLTRRDFFKTQLRALLRAAAYGNLAIMFPMIISAAELNECRKILDICRNDLISEGKKVGDVQVGIMVETPAAVFCADELAENCDFFSIGTNDLTQYICAIDRQNAKLEPFADTHHPAVLRAIRMTVEAGHRHGIWVGICGELGADLSLTESFLRMGIDELSVNPTSVLPLRKKIRSIDLSKPQEQ